MALGALALWRLGVRQMRPKLDAPTGAVFFAVALGVHGRTNRVFPPIWLSLAHSGQHADLDALAAAALASNAPIDVTSQPALWGGKLRGSTATLVAIGNADYETGTDEDHARTKVQANLLELLSAVGRESLDIYYLRVRHKTTEYRISGALQALETAKQDGIIGHIGLCCDGPALGVLGVWQFHDAFETLLVPRNHLCSESYDTLSPLAKERRVGIVTSRPLNWGSGGSFTDSADHWRLRNITQSFYGHTLAQAVISDLAQDHPVLVGVRNAKEVEQVISSPAIERRAGLRAMLQPYIDSFSEGAD